MITLTLNQAVNANDGTTGLGASPGLVRLLTAGGGTISQGPAAIIVGGELDAESDFGDVVLTAANRVGAADSDGIATIPGKLSGFSGGDFLFRNHNAGILVDTLSCGCKGIFSGANSTQGAFFGDIRLVTTGAGDIAVNQSLNSGNAIEIAVAPGYRFTTTRWTTTASAFCRPDSTPALPVRRS